MRIFIFCLLLTNMLTNSSMVQAEAQSAPKSISEYFKNNNLITKRESFYNADKTQRVEYSCEDENMPGGANEGASNPANVHCAAALFLKQSGKWIFSDEVELRYGFVTQFKGHRLEAELLEYGDDDALCCPSEKTIQVFNTESGKLVEDITAEGKPSLIHAIENDADEKQIADMISRGADVNAQDSKGQSALIIATKEGRINVVQLLLSHNAKVNATLKNGETALFFATSGKAANIARLLLDKGADVNARSKDGTTPLIHAAGGWEVAPLKLLLDKGADVNATNDKGYSALVWAVYGYHLDMVRLLLERGANANVQYLSDLTPLHEAASRTNPEFIKLLIDHGANVNAKTEKGKTALIMASEAGKADNVKFLLSKGAEVNAATTEGETALNIASERGYTEIVKLLSGNSAEDKEKSSK